MRRFFTLVLVFFLGVVIGAAFFSEEPGANSRDSSTGELLIRAFSSVYGTTKETASALASEVGPMIGQLREMDDAQLRLFFQTLTARYRLPELSQGQLDGLVKLIRSLTSSGGEGQGVMPQAEDTQSVIDRASDAISGGRKILSAISRIIRVTSGFVQDLTEMFA